MCRFAIELVDERLAGDRIDGQRQENVIQFRRQFAVMPGSLHSQGLDTAQEGDTLIQSCLRRFDFEVAHPSEP
jgi:hypothetical protein